MAADNKKTSGYDFGSVNTIISADDVAEEAGNLSENAPSQDELLALVKGPPYIEIRNLLAGYGKMEILHSFGLAIGKGQSICLIGPNGAGKSTVLHSIYGFTNIFSGSIVKDGVDITRSSPNQKLSQARIAYILQDNSVFPDMTVAENLLMGGFLMPDQVAAKRAVEKVLDKYPRLGERHRQTAGSLSGGERRLLEISRALIMDPDVLLVDEPSIGLEPKFIDSVFEILDELQRGENKTIIMVEQNAKKGLDFADVGYVLVSGQLALAGDASELIKTPEVGRLFLGG